MPHTAEQWNERYRGAPCDLPREPAEILAECLPLLPAGPALDLARGAGRNTPFPAGRPPSLAAADYSSPAFEILGGRGRAGGDPFERSPDRPPGTHKGVLA